jgi:uncharacterized protein YndB with AHSA1/START domain
MVDQQQDQAGLAVRQSVVVDAPRERAFAVFTDGMTSWWPTDSHSIGSAPMAGAVIEPRPGGRWYERGEDGSECDWGRVLAWDPPERVVLAWQISADWKADPDIHTEVEVRFTTEDDGRTRVELEHRHLEAFGERAEQMRGVFGSDGGWRTLLARFAEAAGAGGGGGAAGAS